MSFTETIAAGRAFARPADPPINANRELVATGAANLGGALFGAMPAGGGTSQTAVVRSAGGQSQRASMVTAGAAAGHDAAAGAAAGPDAERHARRGGHRLLDRAHPAGGVPRDPESANDGVPLGAGRLRRRAAVRHAEGHRGGDHRVDDRAREPDLAPAGVGHRSQAGRRRAAAAVARASRRRDVRGPADHPARGAAVLRERGLRQGDRSATWSRSTLRAWWRWT